MKSLIKSNKLIKKLKSYKAIQYLLKHTNADIFFVGGCVRDHLLKRHIADIDIVISNIPFTNLQDILDRFGTANLVGKNFGVIKYKSNSKNLPSLDIALPRTEKSKNYSGNRKDFLVNYDHKINIKDDLKRRDFTINSMALNINNELIDPFLGYADLKNKIIRTTGNANIRFNEDLSRTLRAIRFACQLNFNFEKKTFIQIKKNAHKSINNKLLPRELIAYELLKSLKADFLKTINLWQKSELNKYLLPELYSFYKIKKNQKKLDKILLQYKKFKKINKDNIIIINLILLFITISYENKTINIENSQKITKNIFLNLKLSSYQACNLKLKTINDIFAQINFYLNTNINNTPLYILEKKLFKESFFAYTLFIIKIITKIDNKIFTQQKLNQLNKKYYKIKKNLNKKNILNGDDIKTILKIKPKKIIATILNNLREEQLLGNLKTKKQAIKFVKTNYK